MNNLKIVNPNNPLEFYVAYASGGLWHTVNNGNTFSPIMDNSNTQNIGDFDIEWNTRLIVVGTGENNSSRSSYAGIGILKSTSLVLRPIHSLLNMYSNAMRQLCDCIKIAMRLGCDLMPFIFIFTFNSSKRRTSLVLLCAANTF